MATSFGDQFYLLDPAAPPDAGTVLTVRFVTVVDADEDGSVGPAGGDMIDGAFVIEARPGCTVTVEEGGVERTITGTSFLLDDGRTLFTPSDLTTLNTAVFLSATSADPGTGLDVTAFGPPCFTPGTLIRTPRGEVPVGALRVGDSVLTADSGARTIRWIGRRVVDGRGRFAPIRFETGVIGNRRPLLVSPQHRVLVTGWRAELAVGEPEVLVAATHLVDGRAITRVPCRAVQYMHLLFDGHEIIESEGALTESFHPGEGILAGEAELRAELAALFPELAAPVPEAGGRWALARPQARRTEARLLRCA